jgi:type III restriction enzyme
MEHSQQSHRAADGRFSDAVLVVCPNITVRDRLRELDPAAGEASVYRTRDLVPPEMMPMLARGRVLVTNWHVFEPQSMTRVGDDGLARGEGRGAGRGRELRVHR